MCHTARMTAQTIPVDACSKMVESGTRSCQPLISVPPEPANTTADALAALSTAFTFGSMLVGILVVIAGYAWGRFVAADAKDHAQKAAKERADEYIQEWLAKDAPSIIRQRVDFILDATLGSGNDAEAADDIGKEA